MNATWNRALVTGASSGIGREIAKQLAADGTNLVVVARDQRRLEALAEEFAGQIEVEVLVADLTDGGILNISSLAGELVAPHSATYSATKAFVTSLSESLHQELKGEGVTVTAALPGLTRTEFQQRAEVDVSEMPDVLWQQAEDVAAEALAALNSGKPRVVTGAVNKLADAVARRVIPGVALRAVGKASMSRRGK